MLNIKRSSALIIFVSLFTEISLGLAENSRTVELKNQIFALAKTFEGLGDPDQSKQKTLEVLVNQLVQENPMPAISERLSILEGAWKQVWGPYDYRNDNGGVDPRLGVKEIYQVVFKEGYYYNVAPYYPNKTQDKEQIGLLRGEFKLDSTEPNSLRVRFTNYPGVDPRPSDINIWELAQMAEMKQLENKITIVPTWIVKIFFGGGKLEEVYTDHDTRILYGTGKKPGARRFLYIMSRVN